MAKKTPDPTALNARETANLINMAEPGTVTPRQVQYHIDTSSYPIGFENRVHIVLYLAWLIKGIEEERFLHRRETRSKAEIMREKRRDVRDIGEIPEVVNRKRKARCARDLLKFLKTYLSGTFSLPWSEDHKKVLTKTQKCILEGGLFCEAVYRAFGKTASAEGTALWASLYGHREYIPIISADAGAGIDNLDSIKFEFEENDLLLEDFPEVCYPVRMLEGIAHRAHFQEYHGRRTFMEWRSDTIVLPFIPDSPAAGVVIKTYGLTGRIRGMKYKRADGKTVRPDFGILEDPQTDMSANSPSECDKRERIITGAVLGLTGHTKKMSAIMTCTVIRKNDLADRLLDHERHPEWQGERLPMVKKWADHHQDLWLGTYAELRKGDYPDDENARERAEKEANKFYRKHRKEMDAGAVISWEHCKEPGEQSAIQHAYNLLIDRGEQVFESEYQNNPIDEFEGTDPPLEPKDVLKKLNGLSRYHCPKLTSTVVAFLDARETEIHHVVLALKDGFTSAIVDHGASKVKRTKRGGREAAVKKKIEEVVDSIRDRVYYTEDGDKLSVERIAIDSGWMTDVVYEITKGSLRSPEHLLIPYKGWGGERSCTTRKKIPRRFKGHEWYFAREKRARARLLHANVDFWKAFTEERIRTPQGGVGALTLWGDSRGIHRMPAEHFCSERWARKERPNGDVFRKYALKVGRNENHLWDSLVGCFVLGALQGIRLPDIDPDKTTQKKIILSEIQREKRRGRR